ncbi:MAG: response regulator [Sandaracinaceae bacterium]|nr:response regulator [Sandaracinaceae bacterium]
MSDDERRRAYRFAARIKVRFRSIEELVTAYTEDVSRGGLYVTAAQQLPPGTEVQLSLELPDGGEPALVPARVAYLLDEPTARAQGRNPGMGMQFLEDHVTPLAERIARFLADTIGSGEHERPGPIHALVVDDSASYRELVARSLEDAGHHVTVAENGLEGFGKAMQRTPDIVLTDVTMPVMDGWQLLRLLRARDATKKVPVVFLTSLDSERDRIKGYQRGVDDYIAKPFAGAELVARVLRIVTRSRWEGVLHDPGDRTTMTGDLRQVTLPSLLAFAESERRTAVVTIQTPRTTARVAIHKGVVTSVHIPDPKAPPQLLERLLLVLDWEDGRFYMEEAELPEPTEQVIVQMALLEHARRKDEASR